VVRDRIPPGARRSPCGGASPFDPRPGLCGQRSRPGWALPSHFRGSCTPSCAPRFRRCPAAKLRPTAPNETAALLRSHRAITPAGLARVTCRAVGKLAPSISRRTLSRHPLGFSLSHRFKLDLLAGR
jgi:hypothetical protein